ncbi:MAG: hypothetical protein V2A74_15180, partial [bacterium]
GMLVYDSRKNAPLHFVPKTSQQDGKIPGVTVPETPLKISPFTAEIAHFLDCVDSGKRPAVSIADGARATRLVLRVKAAAVSRETIPGMIPAAGRK